MSFYEATLLDPNIGDGFLTDRTEYVHFDDPGDWSNPIFTRETCTLRLDNDVDGHSVGFEYVKTLLTVITDPNTFTFGPDTSTNTTATSFNLDTDSDGVPDGWIDGWNMTSSGSLGKNSLPDYEFQWGEGEDKNLNGKVDAGETDPNRIDTDGDHLADGWDIVTTANMNPLVYTSEGAFTRYWGELNYTTHFLGTRGGVNIYQSDPTDPTNIDSDGDGLVDGNAMINDLPCELTTSHNGISQTMFTDPSMQDTDSDGLSDGLEISGWEVHILKGSTKQEVRNWTVHSNPTVVDSDNDGVNDYSEFENQSDPYKNDTDGDRILDGDELQGQLTQIEATPPEILKFSDGTQIQVTIVCLYSDTYFGKVCTGKKLKITVRVRDTAGINYVYFKLEGQDPRTIFITNYSKYADVSAEFNYDEWRGFWDGWDVNVTVFDCNNNGNCTKTHIDGFCEGVVKALIKAFWAFVEAVGKLLSAMFNWIWSWIQKFLDVVIKPVIDSAKDFITKISELINALMNNIKSSGCSIKSFEFTKSSDKIKEIIFHPIVIGIFAILGAILIIELLLSLMTMGLFSILKASIAPFIKTIILTSIAVVLTSTSKINGNKGLEENIFDLLGIMNSNNHGRASFEDWVNTYAWAIAIATFVLACFVLVWDTHFPTFIVSIGLAVLSMMCCAGSDNALPELIGLCIAIASMFLALFNHANFIEKYIAEANHYTGPGEFSIKKASDKLWMQSLINSLTMGFAIAGLGFAVADNMYK